MNNLKVGDIVRLKSGSPNMTVVRVVANTVHCQWFSPKHDVMHQGEFILEGIESVPEPRPYGT